MAPPLEDAAAMPAAEHVTRSHRRRQLIGATIRAIAEYGLSRVTLAKVADEARLSPGIVNFYFNSKEQLLLETLKDLEKEFDAHVQASMKCVTDPVAMLERLIDAFFDPVVFTVDKAAVWSAFWGESQARRDYLEICGDKDAEFSRLVRDSLSELCRQDRADIDVNAAALGFEGLLDGFWQSLLHRPGGFDRDQAKRTCLAYLGNLFPQRFERPVVEVSPAASPPRTMMAPWTYSNPEFFDLEVERLFKRTWLVAGHISDLKSPGDFVTFDAVGERAILLRDADGAIRAFHNVCRHRGARIVRGHRGNCKKSIVCPFHGWTYNLDGSLKNVPARKTFPGLDKGAHGLVPLDLEQWNGFLFVRFGGDGDSVRDTLKPIESQVEPYRLRELEPLWPALQEVRAVNWKVVHDIDNEGYHVPVGHPGLHALFGKTYNDVDEEGVGCAYGIVQDGPAKQWSVAKYQKLLPKFRHLPESRQRMWFYFELFPNAVFEFHPDCISYYMTLPVAPDRTLYIERYFGLPDPRPEARAARYLSRRINQRTSAEDESFVEWVQEGMRSSVFPEGNLSTIESGLCFFHGKLQSILPAGRLDRAPSPGAVARINDAMTA